MAQPDVPYVVEIADQAGRIVAVGDVIVANAGEVAGAMVTLPSRLPALAGVFGDTASSVMSAATGTGLTVVDPTLPKAQSQRGSAAFASPRRSACKVLPRCDNV